MDANLLFLGTSGDAIVTGQQLRASGGIVIRIGTNQFVIDPGPGFLVMAKQAKVNPRETTAILVSHNHLNHANDVNAAIHAMSHGGMDTHGVLVAAKSVIHGTEDMTPILTAKHRDSVERYIAVEPHQRLAINDVEIRVTKAYHSDPTTVGFKFFTPKFTLGYTSDTEYHKDLAENYKETDIMVINVKNHTDKEKGQMNVDDATRLINDINPKLCIISHFGVKMLNADPMNLAREIQKATKVQTIAATDGLSIHPASYSAGLRTKTLNLY